MKILGIDPGTATTGYGIIEIKNGFVKSLEYGCIKTSAGTEKSKRLEIIYRSLTEIIKKFSPEIIAVEKLFFSKNVKTALSVGEARGIVLLAAAQNKLKLYEYTPLQVKMVLSGYGKASKGQIKEMVKIHLALDEVPRSDDAADALAIALCHCIGLNEL